MTETSLVKRKGLELDSMWEEEKWEGDGRSKKTNTRGTVFPKRGEESVTLPWRELQF